LFMRALAAVLLCIALFGCQASPTYTAMEQGVDGNRCQMFGYKAGSQDLNRCMFYMYGQREQQNTANNQAMAAALVGAAAVGLAAATVATAPRYRPAYWCGRYRCYYY